MCEAAVNGTLNVLRACEAAGITRVVLTSSMAAVAYGHEGLHGTTVEKPEEVGSSRRNRCTHLAPLPSRSVFYLFIYSCLFSSHCVARFFCPLLLPLVCCRCGLSEKKLMATSFPSCSQSARLGSTWKKRARTGWSCRLSTHAGLSAPRSLEMVPPATRCSPTFSSARCRFVNTDYVVVSCTIFTKKDGTAESVSQSLLLGFVEQVERFDSGLFSFHHPRPFRTW